MAKSWIVLLLFCCCVLAGCGNSGGSMSQSGEAGSGSGAARGLITEVVAEGLWIPWEIAFLPDGRMIFTENPGRIRIVQNGTLLPEPAFDISLPSSGVRIISPGGEEGLTGLAVDANFEANGRIYTMYCDGEPPNVRCKIVRMVMEGNHAREERTLLEFAGGPHHNAGRIKLGPDGLLYISLGDFLIQPQLAQRFDSFGGKVLRMTTDGQPAPGNPFPQAPFVFAMGFRDPQGVAFDRAGNLYGTDHGDVSNDEVNLIRAGGNYGWPNCQGDCTDQPYVAPVRLWHPETLAPSGCTFYNGSTIPQWNGSLFIASLGLADNTYAHHLHRIRFASTGSSTVAEDEILYRGEFGRLRTVVQGPDGFLYFSTSQGDNQDKIIRVRPR